MSLTLLEPIIVNTAATFTFANANVTANLGAGNITITGVYSGNGNGLTNIPGGNVTGTVANSTFATTAGTVTTNAQPNITSVGLLSSLSVGPNSSVTLTGTSGFVRANAIQGIDGVAALYPAYNGVTGAAGVVSNLTVGIGASGSITANGNVTANFYIGNGSSLSSITGSNVTGQVGNALVAGTVYTNAQPNITSVGTLTSLAVSGNANFSNTTSLQQTTEVIAPLTGATGTVTHDFLTGSVFYHTSISANFLPNFTNVPTTNDRVTIVSLILNQGATAYVPNTSNIQIAGSNVAVKWIGGTPPEGTASGIDSISYALIRSDSAWVVTGSYGSYS